ncbi:hypothetical protein D9M70_449140 [compost metagenome]
MGFVGEGLHHPHAADILLDAGVEVADTAIEAAEVSGHPPTITAGDPGGHRHHGGRDQRQLPMHHQHQQQSADEGHDRYEQVLRPVVGDFADFLEVLRQASDQMAGLLVVEEREGELLQMVEGHPPHVRLDVDAEHVTPIGNCRHQAGVEQIDQQKAGRGQEDQRPLLARQKLVDEQLHRDRETEFEQAGQYGAGEVENEQAAIGAVKREETLQHAGALTGGRRPRVSRNMISNVMFCAGNQPRKAENRVVCLTGSTSSVSQRINPHLAASAGRKR